MRSAVFFPRWQRLVVAVSDAMLPCALPPFESLLIPRHFRRFRMNGEPRLTTSAPFPGEDAV